MSRHHEPCAMDQYSWSLAITGSPTIDPNSAQRLWLAPPRRGIPFAPRDFPCPRAEAEATAAWAANSAAGCSRCPGWGTTMAKSGELRMVWGGSYLMLNQRWLMMFAMINMMAAIDVCLINY